MTLIIAVKSCQKDRNAGAHNVIRLTWGADAKRAGIEVRFFVGTSDVTRAGTTDMIACAASDLARHESDEIQIKCDDSYKGLSYKTREICRWAAGKRITNLFLCDIDTYVIVKRLLASGFEKYDYLGRMSWEIGLVKRYEYLDLDGKSEAQEQCHAYASGGIGYFLSHRAADEIASETPTNVCEDLWVGQVLMPLVVKGTLKAENTRNPAYGKEPYSVHFPGRWHNNPPYDPKSGWMEKTHQEHKGIA